VPLLARVLLLAVVVLAGSPAAAHAVQRDDGYLQARDGTRLRYSVERPDGPGPFPVILHYDGYAAGSAPRSNGMSTYADRLLQRGYALVGLSARGTGCSEGEFDPFAKTMGTDGADGVEWAARQPWSDGRVGMLGVSFGGITQLLVAAEQPAGLRAIAPSSALSDLYRDVAYPGGILEYDFVFAWTALQKSGGTQDALTGAPRRGEADCVANFAGHEAANAHPDRFIPTLLLQHPFYDDFDGQWVARAPGSGFGRIKVPAFLLNSWQDEQLPARIFGELDRFARPDRVWVDVTNGNHGRDYQAAYAQERTLDFLDRFVRGARNGFEDRVARLTLAMETHAFRDGRNNVPSWFIERGSIRSPARARALHLRAGGRLTPQPPAAGEAAATYAYPLPSADVVESGSALTANPTGTWTTGRLAWKAPGAPGGAVAYTTDPLQDDLVVAGPASLDLWLRSTAADTDVQVTVTEVRPDGQETYVQRGWLRASHRRLDPERSTPLRPYHTHLRSHAEPLKPGTATPMRVEVLPFAHAFRAGSRLRVWIDAPTSHTGFWAFAFHPEPAVNTVLHDADHPSRLVVGELPGESARAPLPACDALRNQPCRPDPLALGG
jgi:uncharacterized protein